MADQPAKPDWAARQETRDAVVAAMMGDQTAEAHLEAAKDTSEAEEYHELIVWWTDRFDAEIILAWRSSGGVPNDVLKAFARQAVAKEHPEKFNRLRELEAKRSIQGDQREHLVSSAHAAVTEQSLRYKGVVT